MTAFELCGIYNDQTFKLKKGRVEWENINYQANCDKCKISRVVEQGGKAWFMGLRQKSMYIDPDTEIKIIKESV